MNRAQASVLYANHSFVIEPNRARLRALAPYVGRLTGLAPARWRHESRGDVASDAHDASESYGLELLPIVGRPRPARFLYPAWRLRQVFRDVAPDLLHVEQEPYSPAGLELMTLWRRARRPLVLSVHDNRPGRLPRALLRLAVAALNRADAVIYVSEEVANAWERHARPRRIALVPQGVDLSRFSPAQRDPGNMFRAAFFGRLVPEKGIFTLLRALTDVDAEITLDISDFGPGRADVEREAARLGVEARVRFFSATHDQVPDVMRQMDVVVVPSESTARWAEQFGRVLVEAMASGVPVVATKSGAIPAVVGDAGLLVPERDPEALAHALLRLRDDRRLWTDLRRLGLGRAPEFSWERVAEGIAAVYEDVLAGR